MLKKTALFIRIMTVFFIVAVACATVVACTRRDRDFSGDNNYVTSSVAPVHTSYPDESRLPISTKKTAEVAPTDAADVTESVSPTPTLTVIPEDIYTEIAESFFHGAWKSTSGMLYIFDGKSGTITLQDVSAGEVLLEGSYKSSTEDFSEYRLSMTFHGETDSFIAWKYEDSGSVRLITEETGVMYDLLHRVGDN
ncbi:MAG: hypothetical protein E7384_02490 [Ruminococcaceae bacterium]|nr:hypothetical protein [Oscillospiraceae bacterium]